MFVISRKMNQSHYVGDEIKGNHAEIFLWDSRVNTKLRFTRDMDFHVDKTLMRTFARISEQEIR